MPASRAAQHERCSCRKEGAVTQGRPLGWGKGAANCVLQLPLCIHGRQWSAEGPALMARSY